jgi:glycosyltransferase involved in cell wall biosynthesis
MINFSVLMPIYRKEDASNLNQCLESLAIQTRPATEIIIVRDGWLTDELEKVLVVWKRELPLKIIGYAENKGLAYALNYGLQFCSYELVARMDSDDICMPDRFEKQLQFFEENKEIVLLSGFISEFNRKPCDIWSIRKVPQGTNDIIKYMKKRNAFNHMAVMFKKTAILNVGNYKGVNGFEDYDLWIRLVQRGYLVDNLQEILVYVRIGNNMIGRRIGLDYIKREIEFLYAQKKRKFITNIEFILLVFLRIPLRLMPSKLNSFIYINFLR